MKPPRSNSHLAQTNVGRRFSYLASLVRSNLRILQTPALEHQEEARRYIDSVVDSITEARRLVGATRPEILDGLRVLEIGCGQRCLTGLILHSLGAEYTGIDLDVPSYQMTPDIIWRMLRANGLFRLTKAAVRHAAFDRPLFRGVRRALEERGSTLRMDGLDVRQGSADEIGQWDEDFSLIYSYDVFEHLPPAVLTSVVPAMLRRLATDGCCLITLNHFSSICGGHLVEWYGGTFKKDRDRKTRPWEHLRHPEVAGDTFLNRLSIADYVELFQKNGLVLRKWPANDVGRPFLTSEIKAEFPQYSEEELCASEWNFVLVPRGRGQSM